MFKVYRGGKRYMIMYSYDHERKKCLGTFTNVGDSTIVDEFESVAIAEAYCNNIIKSEPTLVFYIEGPDRIIEKTIMNEKVRAAIEKKEARNLAWKIATAVSGVIGITLFLIATYSQVTYMKAIIGWAFLNSIFIMLMLFYGARSIIEVTIMIIMIAIIGGIACQKFTNMHVKKGAVHQTDKLREENIYDRSR